MSSSGRIDTLPLFPELSRRFLALLESLESADWERPVSAQWRVRDVAAHLVDSSMRRISAQRDAYSSSTTPAGSDYASLLTYLNRLNAEWVTAMDRLSPRILIDLLRWSDQHLFALLSSLDPDGPAIWPVAWAGESRSANWFDIAREYTEKWHHAQQIFEATHRPSTIAGRTLMHPCLDTLMRGLPNGLRAFAAPPGTAARIHITGEAGGEWCVVLGSGGWKLSDNATSPIASVTMNQDEAWKVLMKRITAAEARAHFGSIRLTGDRHLGEAILEIVCVMA